VRFLQGDPIFIWQLALCVDSIIFVVVAEKLLDLEEIAFDVINPSFTPVCSNSQLLNHLPIVLGGAV